MTEPTEHDFAAVDEFWADGDFSGFTAEDRKVFARWYAAAREEGRQEERAILRTETGTRGGGSQQAMRMGIAHEYEAHRGFIGIKCKWCGHILGTQDRACTRSQF